MPLRTRSPRPVVVALAAATLAAALVACAGEPSSESDEADEEAGGVTPPPRPELAALHDSVRVAGLDDRRFQPDAWWGVAGAVLEGAPGVEVEDVGRSAEDRPLRRVTLGSGPEIVLMWSQMHGDESTASMALADLFAFLVRRREHPVASTILDGVTLHAIPVLNPDGAARFQRRNAQGIDVNRDARMLSTPEGRALKRVRDAVEPAWAFNLHDQNAGTRLGDTDRPVALALLAPAFDESGDLNDDRRRAMALAGVIVGAVEPVVGDGIARYDDTFNARAFGDLMTAWGSATVLIESGGLPGDPQKQRLRRANFVALVAALEAIANGGWEGVGLGPYRALPPNGRRLADLLVAGGTVAVPGLAPLRADLLVRFDRPLLGEGGIISDIGDMGDVEAQDTVDARGLTLEPFGDAVDGSGALGPGSPAFFRAWRGNPGEGDPVWIMEGDRPTTESGS